MITIQPLGWGKRHINCPTNHILAKDSCSYISSLLTGLQFGRSSVGKFCTLPVAFWSRTLAGRWRSPTELVALYPPKPLVSCRCPRTSQASSALRITRHPRGRDNTTSLRAVRLFTATIDAAKRLLRNVGRRYNHLSASRNTRNTQQHSGHSTPAKHGYQCKAARAGEPETRQECKGRSCAKQSDGAHRIRLWCVSQQLPGGAR